MGEKNIVKEERKVRENERERREIKSKRERIGKKSSRERWIEVGSNSLKRSHEWLPLYELIW